MANLLAQFTAANGTRLNAYTADSGQSFGGDAADFGIQNNRVFCDASGTAVATVTGFTADNEFDLDIDARAVSAVGNLGVWFCGDAPNNGYLLQFFSSYFRLLKYTGGSLDGVLHTSTGYNLLTPPNDYHKIQVQVRTGSLAIYSGVASADTLRWSDTETTHRNGGIALRGTGGSATTGYHIDTLDYTEFTPPPPDPPPWPDGTYDISVNINGNTASSVMEVADIFEYTTQFRYLDVAITSVNNGNPVVPGEQFTVQGTGFSTVNTPTLGGEAVTFDSTTATEITLTCPLHIDIDWGALHQFAFSDGTNTFTFDDVPIGVPADVQTVIYDGTVLDAGTTDSFQEMSAGDAGTGNFAPDAGDRIIAQTAHASMVLRANGTVEFAYDASGSGWYKFYDASAGAHTSVSSYSLDDLGVYIPDTEAPVITLTGPAVVDLLTGDPYVELGATWTDNVDGSGNAAVGGDTVDTSTVGTYVVTYDYTDAAGNAATQVTRTVNVALAPDTEAPVITMLGSTPVTHERGTPYVDAGATAVDNVDGDLTSEIQVTSTVDVDQVGSWTVTYEVTDAAGNSATPVVRTVNVTDTIAPTLSSPVASALGAYAVQGSVDTNDETGVLYYLASGNLTEIAADIIANGVSKNVVATGAVDVTSVGLDAETTYYLHFVQVDGGSNESNVVRSLSFTTGAAPAFTGSSKVMAEDLVADLIEPISGGEI